MTESLNKPLKKSFPKCPTCGADADKATRPFCSKRCADVDLGNWLQGKYAIPAVDAADDSILDGMIADLEAARPNDDNH